MTSFAMNTDTNSHNNSKLQQRRPSLGLQKFRMSFKSKKARQVMVERTCNELAAEGERLCKEGCWEEGIQTLEAAIRIGTSDIKTLSALYSQLGNAYFYLENYSKSLEYHKQDLTLARSMGDKLGEAKACGNIGSALKALRQFDESIACCRMQLDLARGIADKVLESRALYNLGNAYHARGKNATAGDCTFTSDPQEIDDYVRESLEQATRHYELNLKIVKELGDHQAHGRTIGNLGNTHYLLGNYKKAIKYHEERLSIAEVLCDKVACRRAYSNLGNAQVFLGKYSSAAQYYLNALEVSKELGDVACEAQSCFSLGNTYTLMENYHKSVDFHMKHLHFAMKLGDRVGEGRAYWSLGNAYTAMRDHRQAKHFATKHLHLSIELEDREGLETAKRNLDDLDTVLHLSDKYECPSPSPRFSGTSNSEWNNFPMGRKKKLMKKLSNYSLSSNTSSGAYTKHSPRDSRAGSTGTTSPTSSLASSQEDYLAHGIRADDVEEGFLEMVTKCQGHRLDDQRSSLPSPLKTSVKRSSSLVQSREPEDDLFDILWQMQNSRIEDQRSSMPSGSSVPHIMPPTRWHEAEAEVLSDDEFFEMIFSCQSSRIDEQRTSIPTSRSAARKSTMPSEDFFNLIQHLQSTRIEDQRSPLPLMAN